MKETAQRHHRKVIYAELGEMEAPSPHPNPEGRFSPQVEQALREAGWYSGRTVPEEQLEQWLVLELETNPAYHYQLRLFSAAFRVLYEFGGLVIEQDEPGLTCYRETFRFDPLLAVEHIDTYNWQLEEWESGCSFFPIGYHGNGTTADMYIVVDGQGRIWDEEGRIWGNTIEEALETIIVGLMPPDFTPSSSTTARVKPAIPLFIYEMMRKKLGI